MKTRQFNDYVGTYKLHITTLNYIATKIEVWDMFDRSRAILR